MSRTAFETTIWVNRRESNFDRACDSAWRNLVAHAGINEDGHSEAFPEYQRSRDGLMLTFKMYQRIGQEHAYKFSGAMVIHNEECSNEN